MEGEDDNELFLGYHGRVFSGLFRNPNCILIPNDDVGECLIEKATLKGKPSGVKLVIKKCPIPSLQLMKAKQINIIC